MFVCFTGFSCQNCSSLDMWQWRFRSHSYKDGSFLDNTLLCKHSCHWCDIYYLQCLFYHCLSMLLDSMWHIFINSVQHYALETVLRGRMLYGKQTHFHWQPANVVCDRLMWWIQMFGASACLWGGEDVQRVRWQVVLDWARDYAAVPSCMLVASVTSGCKLQHWPAGVCTVDGWRGITCLQRPDTFLGIICTNAHFIRAYPSLFRQVVLSV